MSTSPRLIKVLWIVATLVLVGLIIPAQAATTGLISGVVQDGTTKAALSGANVTLSEINYSTVTDAKGGYLFTAVPPGTYQMKISLVGYAEQIVTQVAVTQDQSTLVNVDLKPAVVEAAGAEAVVTAAKVHIRPEQTSSTYVVSKEDEQLTLSQPNDRYQFPGLVFTQPGVVPDSTFFPHVRGARANQVGYMIDGIPIVEPNNNVFATNIVTVGLNRMELFTGGWDAQYGSQVGGVINEVILRGDQVRGGRFEVGAGSPTQLAQFILEAGDAGAKPGSSWYVCSNAWNSEFPGDSFLSKTPLVLDGIVKGVMPINNKDSLTFLANHGYAAFELHYPHTREFDPSTGLFVDSERQIDNTNQGYNLDALTFMHSVNDTSYWTARVYRLSNYIRIHADSDIYMLYQARQQAMWGLQMDYVNQISSNHVLYAGLWGIQSQNRWESAQDIEPIFGPLDSRANNDTMNIQAYIQDTRQIAPRTELALGLRYERMNYQRPVYGDLKLADWSPRAGLTYQLVPDKLLFRASAGKYVQFPPASRTGVLFREGDPFNPYDPPSWYMLQEGKSNLKPQEDINKEVGLEYKVNNATLMTATAFLRTSKQMLQRWAGPTDNTNAYDPGTFEPYPFRFASNGRGRFSGVELKVDHKLSENLRAWVSYTRLNARATTSMENAFPLGISTTGEPNDLFPVDWDQRDTIAAAADWKVGRLEVNPWLVWGSGFPYGLQSGLDIDPTGGFNYIHDGDGNVIPILVNGHQQQPTDPNTLRTGSNFVLSLNLSYHQKKDFEWFVDIYNILDRRDVTNLVWYHPDSGAILGMNPPNATYPHGFIEYVPFTTTLPRSVTFGFRQSF